jgi:hypothetical protein
MRVTQTKFIHNVAKIGLSLSLSIASFPRIARALLKSKEEVMGTSQSHNDFKDCVTGLASRPVTTKARLWDLFLNVDATCEDIFGMLQPTDVRSIKTKQPMNLVLVIIKVYIVCIDRILQEISSYEFFTSLLFIYAKQCLDILENSSSGIPDLKKISNAVRILSRVIPFIIEDDSDSFCERVMWRGQLPLFSSTAPPEKKEEGVAEAKAVGEVVETSLDAEDEAFFKKDLSPLAQRIIRATYRLCFLPNYTVSHRSKCSTFVQLCLT